MNSLKCISSTTTLIDIKVIEDWYLAYEDLCLILLKKKVFEKKGVLKMHGHKSKFVNKGLGTKLKRQEGFEKDEKVLKI